MLFQAEPAFESVQRGPDPPTDRGKSAVPDGLVLPARPDRMDAQAFGEERLELPPGEALVREDHLTFADEMIVAFQQCGHHRPFAELGFARHHDTGMPSAVVSRLAG